MRGFAAASMFSAGDLEAHRVAAAAVEAMPDDGRSCHDVAAAVLPLLPRAAGLFEPELVRGSYGMVDHSWIRLPSGTLLDCYAPGRHPMVQLVDARTITLPETRSYAPAEEYGR